MLFTVARPANIVITANNSFDVHCIAICLIDSGYLAIPGSSVFNAIWPDSLWFAAIHNSNIFALRRAKYSVSGDVVA